MAANQIEIGDNSIHADAGKNEGKGTLGNPYILPLDSQI